MRVFAPLNSTPSILPVRRLIPPPGSGLPVPSPPSPRVTAIDSGRTKTSTVSPFPIPPPVASAVKIGPDRVSTRTPAGSRSSTRPGQRLLSPTNPATNAVFGSW